MVSFPRWTSALVLASAFAAPPGLAGPAPEPLPPQQLAQRLSLKLRRASPTAAEVAALQQSLRDRPGEFAQIYDELVDSYLASGAFRGTVEQFHAVWWRLQPRESTRAAAWVVTEDRPYLELFARDYLYVDGRAAGDYRYAGVRTEEPLPAEPGDWRAVRLSPDEPRYRSVLSDLDFLNRFPDTPSNHNRARANYVLKTFLCETITPMPTPPDWEPTTPPDDPHGTNPDCIGCHWRLDPLARFFDHWRPPFGGGDKTWFDAEQGAIGKLYVKNADGSVSGHDGVGDGDLARILQGEPRFRQCLAQKVWEFMLGPGVKLDQPTQAKLVQAFERRGNFKDVVREAARHPWFWSTEEAPPLKFGDVGSAFDGCAGCHRVGGTNPVPFDAHSYPFRQDPRENVALLTRMWGAINGEPGFKRMPPAPRPALPSDMLARLREWIAAGAVDDEGRITLTDAQIQEVLHD